MARAHNIYLVARHEYDGVDPIASFTVKHEMVSWLKRQPRETLVGCSVLRMPDGRQGDHVSFKIEELIDALPLN